MIERNDTNASKCLSLFVKSAAANHDPLLETLLNLDSIIYYLIYFIIGLETETLLPATFNEYVASRRDQLCECHNFQTNIPEIKNNKNYMESLMKTLDWINKL